MAVAKKTTEENVEVKETVKPKKFAASDEIECSSITAGELFVEGIRSKDLYTFVDMDDIQYIRYDDLAAAARSKAACVWKPLFIIRDADFLKEFPGIEDVYGGLYSSADLKALLKLSPNQLKTKVNALPEGAKDSLKTIVTTMIDNGSFDSIQKIKVLDEIYDTKMLFKITGE